MAWDRPTQQSLAGNDRVCQRPNLAWTDHRASSNASPCSADRFSLTGGIFGWVTAIDLNYVGYAIVALFVVTRAVALSVWHFGRIEDTGLPACGRRVHNQLIVDLRFLRRQCG